MPLTEMKNTIGIDKNIFIRCPICSNKIRTKLYHSTVLDKKSKKLQTKCATLKAPEKRAFSCLLSTQFFLTQFIHCPLNFTQLFTQPSARKKEIRPNEPIPLNNQFPSILQGFLLAEISFQQAFECFAVSSLISSHLMHGIMNCIQTCFFRTSCQIYFTCGSAVLSVHSHLQVLLGAVG